MARYSGVRNNLNKIKKNLIDKMLMNEELVKLLYHPTDSNPFDKPVVEDVGSLVGKYISRKQKFDETITDECMVILVKFEQRPSSSGGVFRDVNIIFEVISHINIIDTLDNGDDRMLCVLDLIDNMVINSRADEWLGKARYVGEYEININTNFVGTRLVYRITQFS